MADPFGQQSGPSRKPTMAKSYMVIFVGQLVNAVHLVEVAELTSAAFLLSQGII